MSDYIAMVTHLHTHKAIIAIG